VNKSRRRHKQWLRGALDRHRRTRAFLQFVTLRSIVMLTVGKIQNIRSTPAEKFVHGKIGKTAAIAQAVIDGHDAMYRYLNPLAPRALAVSFPEEFTAILAGELRRAS
jgi:hypothetical protein